LIYQWLLVAHITVLGYWLGAELVINSTYRYVCYSDSMPVAERLRLMAHVMKVDQHVRYALVLQVTLGVALAGHLTLIPGGRAVVIGAGLIGVLWLAFVEAVHRLGDDRKGEYLAAIDRGSRYFVAVLASAVALGLIGDVWLVPGWLRWKLVFFSGVILCGVGIRLVLIGQFGMWTDMRRDGSKPETEAGIRASYVRATAVLVLLWMFLIAIVIVSVLKPV